MSDTTGFKRAEIQVWVSKADGKPEAATVPAMVKDGIAVHRNVAVFRDGEPLRFGKMWAVTHAASGLAYLKFTSLNASKAFASRLPSLGIPGLDGLKIGENPKWTKKQMQELREAVRNLATQCTDEYGGTYS